MAHSLAPFQLSELALGAACTKPEPPRYKGALLRGWAGVEVISTPLFGWKSRLGSGGIPFNDFPDGVIQVGWVGLKFAGREKPLHGGEGGAAQPGTVVATRSTGARDPGAFPV